MILRFIFVLFCLLICLSQLLSAGLPRCPKGWTSTNSTCYVSLNMYQTKSMGQQWCEAVNHCSHLPFFKTEEEFADFRQLYCKPHGKIFGLYTWLGYTCDHSEAETDTTCNATVSNWEPEEPNNYRKRGEHCVALIKGECKWRDVTCDADYGVICQLRTDSDCANQPSCHPVYDESSIRCPNLTDSECPDGFNCSFNGACCKKPTLKKCPPGWHSTTTHCYKPLDVQERRDSAELRCSRENHCASLPIFKNGREHRDFKDLYCNTDPLSALFNFKYAWLGYKCRHTYQGKDYTCGVTLMHHWTSQEPSNTQQLSELEQCTEITRGSCQFNDVRCKKGDSKIICQLRTDTECYKEPSCPPDTEKRETCSIVEGKLVQSDCRPNHYCTFQGICCKNPPPIPNKWECVRGNAEYVCQECHQNETPSSSLPQCQEPDLTPKPIFVYPNEHICKSRCNTQTGLPTCPKGWTSTNSTCYVSLNMYQTQSMGQQWCEAVNHCSHLPFFKTEEEFYDFKQLYCKPHEKIFALYTWLGYTCDHSEAETDTTCNATVSNWEPEEPNNYRKRGEHCVALIKGECKWRDVACNADYGVICQLRTDSDCVKQPSCHPVYDESSTRCPNLTDSECPDGFNCSFNGACCKKPTLKKCPPGWHSTTTHCYKPLDVQERRDSAELRCRRENHCASLPIFKNGREHRDFKDIYCNPDPLSALFNFKYAWLGYKCRHTYQRKDYTCGVTLMHHWTSQEPSNTQQLSELEQCTEITRGSCQFNDVRCKKGDSKIICQLRTDTECYKEPSCPPDTEKRETCSIVEGKNVQSDCRPNHYCIFQGLCCKNPPPIPNKWECVRGNAEYVCQECDQNEKPSSSFPQCQEPDLTPKPIFAYPNEHICKSRCNTQTGPISLQSRRRKAQLRKNRNLKNGSKGIRKQGEAGKWKKCSNRRQRRRTSNKIKNSFKGVRQQGKIEKLNIGSKRCQPGRKNRKLKNGPKVVRHQSKVQKSKKRSKRPKNQRKSKNLKKGHNGRRQSKIQKSNKGSKSPKNPRKSKYLKKGHNGIRRQSKIQKSKKGSKRSKNQRKSKNLKKGHNGIRRQSKIEKSKKGSKRPKNPRKSKYLKKGHNGIRRQSKIQKSKKGSKRSKNQRKSKYLKKGHNGIRRQSKIQKSKKGSKRPKNPRKSKYLKKGHNGIRRQSKIQKSKKGSKRPKNPRKSKYLKKGHNGIRRQSKIQKSKKGSKRPKNQRKSNNLKKGHNGIRRQSKILKSKKGSKRSKNQRKSKNLKKGHNGIRRQSKILKSKKGSKRPKNQRKSKTLKKGHNGIRRQSKIQKTKKGSKRPKKPGRNKNLKNGPNGVRQQTKVQKSKKGSKRPKKPGRNKNLKNGPNGVRQQSNVQKSKKGSKRPKKPGRNKNLKNGPNGVRQQSKVQKSKKGSKRPKKPGRNKNLKNGPNGVRQQTKVQKSKKGSKRPKKPGRNKNLKNGPNGVRQQTKVQKSKKGSKRPKKPGRNKNLKNGPNGVRQQSNVQKSKKGSKRPKKPGRNTNLKNGPNGVRQQTKVQKSKKGSKRPKKPGRNKNLKNGPNGVRQQSKVQKSNKGSKRPKKPGRNKNLKNGPNGVRQQTKIVKSKKGSKRPKNPRKTKKLKNDLKGAKQDQATVSTYKSYEYPYSYEHTCDDDGDCGQNESCYSGMASIRQCWCKTSFDTDSTGKCVKRTGWCESDSDCANDLVCYKRSEGMDDAPWIQSCVEKVYKDKSPYRYGYDGDYNYDY